jgi:hypothetical protein
VTAITALVLALVVEPGCVLDTIQAFVVEPATVSVVQTEQCGPVTCWRRFVVMEGQRKRESRVCEVDHAGRGLVISP